MIMKRSIIIVAYIIVALSCKKQVPVASHNNYDALSGSKPETEEIQDGYPIADDTWYIAESKSFIGVRYPSGGCAYQQLMPDEATISWKMTSTEKADVTIAYRFPSYNTTWPEPDKHFSLVLHDVTLTQGNDGAIRVNQETTSAEFFSQEMPIPIVISKASGILCGNHTQFLVQGETQTNYGQTHEFILRIGKLTKNRGDAGFGKMTDKNIVDFFECSLVKINNQTQQKVTVNIELEITLSDNRLGEGPFEVPAGESAGVYLAQDRLLRVWSKGIRISFEDGTERYFEKQAPNCYDFLGLPSPNQDRLFELSVVSNHWDRSYYDVFEYTLTPGT